jgi:hypothetical protein
MRCQSVLVVSISTSMTQCSRGPLTIAGSSTTIQRYCVLYRKKSLTPPVPSGACLVIATGHDALVQSVVRTRAPHQRPDPGGHAPCARTAPKIVVSQWKTGEENTNPARVCPRCMRSRARVKTSRPTRSQAGRRTPCMCRPAYHRSAALVREELQACSQYGAPYIRTYCQRTKPACRPGRMHTRTVA